MGSYHFIVLYMICGALCGMVLSLRDDVIKLKKASVEDFKDINHLYKELNALKDKLK